MRMGCLACRGGYGCSFADNLDLEVGWSVKAMMWKTERSSLPELMMTGSHE